jgi:hypothetical protein
MIYFFLIMVNCQREIIHQFLVFYPSHSMQQCEELLGLLNSMLHPIKDRQFWCRISLLFNFNLKYLGNFQIPICSYRCTLIV